MHMYLLINSKNKTDLLCNAVSLGHVALAHLKFEGRLGTTRQRILESYMDFCFVGVPRLIKEGTLLSFTMSSHFIALFIIVGDETRNDSDNDTLIEDGSGMCWTSGSPGMSDHGLSKNHQKSGCVLRAVGSGKSQGTL